MEAVDMPVVATRGVTTASRRLETRAVTMWEYGVRAHGTRTRARALPLVRTRRFLPGYARSCCSCLSRAAAFHIRQGVEEFELAHWRNYDRELALSLPVHGAPAVYAVVVNLEEGISKCNVELRTWRRLIRCCLPPGSTPPVVLVGSHSDAVGKNSASVLQALELSHPNPSQSPNPDPTPKPTPKHGAAGAQVARRAGHWAGAAGTSLGRLRPRHALTLLASA